MHFLYLNHLQNRNLRKNQVLLNNLIQMGQIKKLSIKEIQTGLPCYHMLPRCQIRLQDHLAGPKTQRILSESVQLLGNH